MTVQIGTVVKAVATISMPQGVIAQNVFYWKFLGTSPRPDVDVLNAIRTAVDAMFHELRSHVSEEVVLEDVIVHEWDYTEVLGWHTGRFIGQGSLVELMLAVDEMLPHAVAATITTFTQDVKKRSRKSLAGFTEFTGEASVWLSGTIAAIAAFAGRWLLDVVVAGADFLEPGLAGKSGGWWPFISALTSLIAGSQRQRKPGVGI